MPQPAKSPALAVFPSFPRPVLYSLYKTVHATSMGLLTPWPPLPSTWVQIMVGRTSWSRSLGFRSAGAWDPFPSAALRMSCACRNGSAPRCHMTHPHGIRPCTSLGSIHNESGLCQYIPVPPSCRQPRCIDLVENSRAQGGQERQRQCSWKRCWQITRRSWRAPPASTASRWSASCCGTRSSRRSTGERVSTSPRNRQEAYSCTPTTPNVPPKAPCGKPERILTHPEVGA